MYVASECLLFRRVPHRLAVCAKSQSMWITTFSVSRIDTWSLFLLKAATQIVFSSYPYFFLFTRNWTNNLLISMREGAKWMQNAGSPREIVMNYATIVFRSPDTVKTVAVCALPSITAVTTVMRKQLFVEGIWPIYFERIGIAETQSFSTDISPYLL